MISKKKSEKSINYQTTIDGMRETINLSSEDNFSSLLVFNVISTETNFFSIDSTLICRRVK